MAEWGIPDFEVGTWSGLIGPKGTPAEVVQKVNAAVADVLNDPAIRKRLIDEGSEIRVMTSAEFGQFIRSENARWVKVVKEAGIKPE